MKHIQLVAVALAVFATASLSVAQNGQLGQGRLGKGHARRQNAPVNANNAVQQVDQLLKQAKQSLKVSLPIYDGLRVRAEALVHRAHKAIKEGTSVTSVTNTGANGQKVNKLALPNVKSEGHNKSRYSAQQVMQSQQNMNNALIAIQKAMQIIGNGNSIAANDLMQAGQDIQAGMAIHANG